ncbi:MAG: wax ester/triacylglycerol synthase family O-acyltransferase [Isosphaerales bacterium]
MEVDRKDDEPLSPVDTACLRIEDRTSLIVNAGAMVFAEPLDFERVKKDVSRRFLCFHRFRQRVVWPEFPPGTPHWEDDPLFDLRSHLHRIALPAPGNDQALQEVLSHLISTPLDRARPLWEIHLIENYGNGCVLLFRLHHCLADGMALLHVLRSMTGRSPETQRTAPAPATRPPQGEGRRTTEVNPLIANGLILYSQMLWLLYTGLANLFQPTHGRNPRGTASDAATTLRKLLSMGQDSPTVFNGPLGVSKQVAWSDPIPLGEIRAIARLFGGSVNAVLLSAATGALRRYLQRRGEPVSDVILHASVPVNLRHGGSADELGNRFGLNLLALPIDRDDPVERVTVLRQRLKDLKESAEADVVLSLMNLYGIAPEAIGSPLIDLVRKNVTAVVSAVPGPPKAIEFAGKRIDRMIFWVPQSGRLGLGLSLLTYRGSVSLGVVTDAGLVPDPESIVQAFRDELERLIEAVPVAVRASASRIDSAEGRRSRQGHPG